MKKEIIIEEEAFFNEEILDSYPLTLLEKIKMFLDEFRGEEIPLDRVREMFDLFGTAYQTYESSQNITCTGCVLRVRFALDHYYENNKNIKK
jgi:hypothetical protein